ncbi:hypothetical protein HPB50_004257 [Hyalomma asiaticum]|uniref:Uncharacterized protein n=1 Tax=Hyalomma asiaticum TaxID=266040 RepID=A0ACB7TEQ9_HYAAI|nr:hypothetical protein HPB50_004257 [Hyalomma asiaticum]
MRATHPLRGRGAGRASGGSDQWGCDQDFGRARSIPLAPISFTARQPPTPPRRCEESMFRVNTVPPFSDDLGAAARNFGRIDQANPDQVLERRGRSPKLRKRIFGYLIVFILGSMADLNRTTSTSTAHLRGRGSRRWSGGSDPISRTSARSARSGDDRDGKPKSTIAATDDDYPHLQVDDRTDEKIHGPITEPPLWGIEIREPALGPLPQWGRHCTCISGELHGLVLAPVLDPTPGPPISNRKLTCNITDQQDLRQPHLDECCPGKRYRRHIREHSRRRWSNLVDDLGSDDLILAVHLPLVVRNSKSYTSVDRDFFRKQAPHDYHPKLPRISRHGRLNSRPTSLRP